MAIHFASSSITSPSGKILQTEQWTNASSSTVASTTTNDYMNVNITPKGADSKFWIQFHVRMSHNDQSIRCMLGIDDDFTLCARSDANNTNAAATESWKFHSSSGTIATASYQDYNGSYIYTHSGSAQWNCKIRTYQAGGTLYMNRSLGYDDTNRGKPMSNLYIMELGA